MVGSRGRIASQVSKGYHFNFWLLPTLYPFLGWLSWDWCLVFCNHACKCITQACFSFLVIPALNPPCQSHVLDLFNAAQRIKQIDIVMLRIKTDWSSSPCFKCILIITSCRVLEFWKFLPNSMASSRFPEFISSVYWWLTLKEVN